MSAIIPFDSKSALPAYLTKRTTSINTDVLSARIIFPVLSIMGKVFTLVKGNERKVLTKPEDPDEVLQFVNLTVLRANTKSRVFYAKAYSESDSEGARPTCFSHDGVTPDASVKEPQSKKCQGCTRNIWGVRDGKGTECSSKTRLVITDPTNVDKEPFLLNVPPASRKSFAQAVEAAEARGIDYNAVVMRVSFDKEAPSPKLIFKPIGWLDDVTYRKVSAMYDDELVREMAGVPGNAKPAAEDDAEPAVSTDELDAAIAARTAVETAKAVPAPEPAPAKAVKAKSKPAAKAEESTDTLLADIDALIGNTDD